MRSKCMVKLSLGVCYYSPAMDKDDEDESSTPAEDAFYRADYDEDTIDYYFDADTLQEEESFEPELATNWDILDVDIEQAPEPVFEEEESRDGGSESGEVWDDDDQKPVEQYAEPWPLGLIGAAVIALLLLAAGGYGIIQQRTTMEEEIRQLRAAMSTAASKEEVAAGRQAHRALEVRNESLQERVDALQLENQTLRDAASKQRAQPPETAPLSSPVVAQPPPKPAPATPQGSTTPGWFVNFASYTKRSTAESWATKLSPADGKVAVLSGTKGATHYYRVRIIDLPNREIAEKIALKLEQTHNLSRLWIGKQ